MTIFEIKDTFYKYTFNCNNLENIFFLPCDIGKECIFINRFNLGGFGNLATITPLHITSPLIKKGNNKFIGFETECLFSTAITLNNNSMYIK